MKTVDRVVSLGSNCEVTDSIRDYYGTGRAYPFDWWITPLDSVVRLLESRFEGLLDPREVSRSADAGTVVCRRFNIMHHHDFARSPDGKVLPTLREQLPQVQEKFRHLTQRFLRECASGRTLFVRNRVVTDSHLRAPGDESSDEALAKLWRALRATFPEADMTLLATNLGRTGTLEGGRIILDEITDHFDGSNHRVSPRGWNELFDRQGFRLAQPAQP
jgi:hypothetical protein